MKGVTTGLNAWLLQRLTAVYLLLFMVAMPVTLFVLDIDSYAEWKNVMAVPVMAMTWVLFFACMIGHAWVGIRDVIIDYVHAFRMRLVILALLAFWLISLLIWVMQVLLLGSGGIA